MSLPLTVVSRENPKPGAQAASIIQPHATGTPYCDCTRARLRFSKPLGRRHGDCRQYQGQPTSMRRNDILQTQLAHISQLRVFNLHPSTPGTLPSGGDGTIAAVAGVLRDTGIPLGIVPRGTANGEPRQGPPSS